MIAGWISPKLRWLEGFRGRRVRRCQTTNWTSEPQTAKPPFRIGFPWQQWWTYCAVISLRTISYPQSSPGWQAYPTVEERATTYFWEFFVSVYDTRQNIVRIPLKSAKHEHKRSAQKSSLERAHIPTWRRPLLCFIYRGPKGHHIDFHTCTQVGNWVMEYSL